MNKKQIITIAIGTAFLAFSVIALYFIKSKNKVSQHADYRIAIFEPAVHPAIEEIVRGFKETITSANKKSYVFDEYNANGNSTLLRAQADEIVQHDYDLVFTIGAQCSQSIHELTKKRQSRTPQVFSAVDDPIAIGITQTTAVTGVKDTPLYEQQIDALLRLKPTIKRILLVYNPAHGTGLEKDRAQLEEILHRKNISLQAVEITHHTDIAQKVPGFLTNTDVVLVLTDNTVVSGIDSLITLCNRYGVLLYASDLNSGDKGAALSFGVRQYDYGLIGAQLAKRIFEEKQLPSFIPVVTMDKQYLKINTKTMRDQGLPLTQEQLASFKQSGGIVV